jgi:hypothetical protein
MSNRLDSIRCRQNAAKTEHNNVIDCSCLEFCFWDVIAHKEISVTFCQSNWPFFPGRTDPPSRVAGCTEELSVFLFWDDIMDCHKYSLITHSRGFVAQMSSRLSMISYVYIHIKNIIILHVILFCDRFDLFQAYANNSWDDQRRLARTRDL